jgi:hypothetical protein
VGDGGAGGQPAGKGHAVPGPVQRGQARLQHVPRRVPATRVLVPSRQINKSIHVPDPEHFECSDSRCILHRHRFRPNFGQQIFLNTVMSSNFSEADSTNFKYQLVYQGCNSLHEFC